jgi:hypothetical protein
MDDFSVECDYGQWPHPILITALSTCTIIMQIGIYYIVIFFPDYATEIMDLIVTRYKESPQELRDRMDDLRANAPQPLAAGYEKPDQQQLIEDFQSRFVQNTLIN